MDQPVIIKERLQCEKCNATFPDYLDHCPECGSTEFVGFQVVNPIARLPMESILAMTAHVVWIIGTIACITLLWHTDTQDAGQNLLLAFGGFILLAFSVIMSVALFGIAEVLKRTVRIQRRVRAFFEEEAHVPKS